MRNLAKCVLAWLLCVAVCIGCMPIQTAYAGVSISAWMDSYTPGNTITIMWMNNVEGAHHYDCTVLNETTGVYARNRSTSSSGYDAYVTAQTAGVYKIWVGAVDANGNDITSSIIRVTVYEASCEHDWNDDTGTCIDCGEACSHGNGVYEVESGSYSESISDTQHKIIWTYDEECKICRYVLNSSAQRTEVGDHKFDSNGDCTLCNYRAACKHIETTTEHLSTSYEQKSAGYHKVKVVRNIICANPNCGKMIEYGGEIETWSEEHTMQGDVCTLCGYAVQREPVTVTVSSGQSSAYTGETISASCSASGGTGNYVYYWSVKHNGSEVYSTGSWDTRGSYTATAEGTYSFSVRVDDHGAGESASASTSGITVTKRPCEHTSITTVQDGAVQYIKASDSKHTVRTNWVDVCDGCGARLNPRYSDETQDHNYSNGNCVNCGAAAPMPEASPCPHPAMISSELSRSWRAAASVEQHLVDITWEDRCSSCNALLNKTRVTTEYENHNYNGSTCTKCGFAKQAPTEVPITPNPEPDTPVIPAPVTEVPITPVPVTEVPITPVPVTEAPKVEMPQICSVYGAEHVYDYTGYEAAHETDLDYPGSHNIFKRCKCGHVIYTGKTKTTLEQPVCCYCGNHQYGEVYQDGDVMKQKCVNCSQTRITTAIENDCNVTGQHSYDEITYNANHPHEAISGKCKCGAVTTNPSVENGISLTCCLCGNHAWQIMQIDGTRCFMGCNLCQARTETVATAEQKLIYDFIGYEMVIVGNDPFSEIGGQAIKKMTEAGFVYINETVNTTSDIGGSLIDAGIDVAENGLSGFGKKYDETILQNWEHLIIQMLVRNPQYGYAGEEEFLIASTTKDMLEKANSINECYDGLKKAEVVKSLSDWVDIYDNTLEVMAKDATVLIEAQKKGTATAEQINRLNELTEKAEKMKETRSKLDEMSRRGKNAEEVMKGLQLALEGLSAWENTAQIQQDYLALGMYYNANMEKLESIISAANSIGNETIALAAMNVQETLNEQVKKTAEQINEQLFEEKAISAGTAVLQKSAGTLLGEVLEDVAPPLKIIEGVGMVADWALQWGDAYDSAQAMMLLRNMDNSLGWNDLGRSLNLDAKDAYYLCELYNVLQIEGLMQTKEFLNAYEAGNGLSVSEFGIYDLEAYQSKIDSRIDGRKTQKEYMYTLYNKMLQEEATGVSALAPQPTPTSAPVNKIIGTYGIISIEGGANVRSDAGQNNALVTTVPQGFRFVVLEAKDASNGRTWYKIKVREGVYGWISSGTTNLN